MILLKKILGTAFSFIGTVIGAGMMTGAEIMQYFGSGILSLFAIVFSCALMSLFIYFFSNFCTKRDINSVEEFGACLFGKYNRIFTAFISFGIVTCSGGMLSGTGELFFDLFGIRPIILSLSIALIGGILSYKGIKWINSLNFVAIPFILLFIIIVFLFIDKNINNCLIAPAYGSIVFSLYNIAFALPLCCSVEKLCGSDLCKALVFFGVITALGMFAISLIITNSTAGSSLPLFDVVKNSSTAAAIIYAAVLFLASGTTYVTAMLAFRKNKSTMILASLSALLISLFEIKNIVKYIYPITGLLCIICLIRIFIVKVKL